MTPEQADKVFQSVHEARQELLGASYGMRNTKAYEREYGEYTGQMEGELYAAEHNLN